MPGPEIVILGAILLIVLVLLVQVYLSMRPSFIWGLFMPFIFFLFFLYAVFDTPILPLDLTPNHIGRYLFIGIGLGGLLVSAIVLVLCRIRRNYREKRRAQEREQRILARQQRLAAEAAILGENGSSDGTQAELEKIERIRSLALAKSERLAREIEEKRQARLKRREEKKQRGKKEKGAAAQTDLDISSGNVTPEDAVLAESNSEPKETPSETGDKISRQPSAEMNKPLTEGETEPETVTASEPEGDGKGAGQPLPTPNRIDMIVAAARSSKRIAAASVNFYRYVKLSARRLIRGIGRGGKRLLQEIKKGGQAVVKAGGSGQRAVQKTVIAATNTLKSAVADKAEPKIRQPKQENTKEEEGKE